MNCFRQPNPQSCHSVWFLFKVVTSHINLTGPVLLVSILLYFILFYISLPDMVLPLVVDLQVQFCIPNLLYCFMSFAYLVFIKTVPSVLIHQSFSSVVKVVLFVAQAHVIMYFHHSTFQHKPYVS
jgi:hypothetical protein